MCVCVCAPVPPEFAEDQPNLVEVIEDDVATLPVKVSANPDDISCKWIIQGEKVLRGNGHFKISVQAASHLFCHNVPYVH